MPKINIHVDELVKMPYINKKELFRGKTRDKGISVLGPRQKLLVLVLKDIFLIGMGGNKAYSSSKKKEITRLVSSSGNKAYLQKTLSSLFGERQADKVMGCIRKGKWKRLQNMRLSLRFSIFMKHAGTWRHLCSYMRYMFAQTKNRMCHPLFISFLGVDGSGKTTAIDSIVKVIQRQHMAEPDIIYMGRWGGYILPIHKVKSKEDQKITLSMDEVLDRKIKKGFMYALNLFLRDAFFITEYTLRIFLKILT
jgi:hypothetical protein